MPMGADWPRSNCLTIARPAAVTCQCLDRGRAGSRRACKRTANPKASIATMVSDERPPLCFEGYELGLILHALPATKSNQSPLIRVERRTALDGFNTTIEGGSMKLDQPSQLALEVPIARPPRSLSP